MAPQYSRLLEGVVDHVSPPRTVVGRSVAPVLFVFMLFAFVIESQLTQYVQASLNFRQPYLLFYIAHSAMLFVFPVHLLYLHITTSFTAKAYLRGLRVGIKRHFSSGSQMSTPDDLAFPTAKLAAVIIWCTIGITIPGLLWFAAITLASVSDVTAIWNSNAFWAYVLSVRLQHLSWEPRRLVSVVIASLGVLVVVYGSGSSSEDAQPLAGDSPNKPRAPFLGNLLTLIASGGYGLYQVAYKMYAVPPTECEPSVDDWRRLSFSSDSVDETLSAGPNSLEMKFDDTTVHPPPFGLYANMLTSGMGVITLFVLWSPLPILHLSSVEPFEWPDNLSTILGVAGIALSGVTFYMCFMILLGIWGPIITSVGNLLTIVLVMISDVIFGDAADTLTVWSLVGSGMIVCAFAVLAYDTFKR